MVYLSPIERELFFFAQLVPLQAWLYWLVAGVVYATSRKKRVFTDLGIACFLECFAAIAVYWELPIVINQPVWSIAIFTILVCGQRRFTFWANAVLVLVVAALCFKGVEPISTCTPLQSCVLNPREAMIWTGLVCNATSEPALAHCLNVLKPHLWEKHKQQFANGKFCDTVVQWDLIQYCRLQDTIDTCNFSSGCRRFFTDAVFLEIQQILWQYEKCEKTASGECEVYKQKLAS